MTREHQAIVDDDRHPDPRTVKLRQRGAFPADNSDTAYVTRLFERTERLSEKVGRLSERIAQLRSRIDELDRMWVSMENENEDLRHYLRLAMDYVIADMDSAGYMQPEWVYEAREMLGDVDD